MNTATKTVTATGTLKTALTTEWTLAITAQDITQSSGVTVTQGSVTGTLKMALTGSTTSVVVTAADGVIFVTTSNVVIGATTVVLANVNTATNSVTLASYQEPSIRTPVTAVSAFGAVDTEGAMNMLDTNNLNTAKIFLNTVNSSIAMHNVSTQFADGGEFGFGGEIGISTNKLPPRGPVGIEQLTSYKYLVSGKGVIRS